MNLLLSIATMLSVAGSPLAAPIYPTVSSRIADTAALAIASVTVFVSLKHDGDYSRQPVMATSLEQGTFGEGMVAESKDLSLTVPGMLHADHGSRMTGSIYVRGLGSRMDQPAVGLYLDGVPVMNKNNYDLTTSTCAA